jgi:glycosyltransferase involved in cell wall biosynthesis
LRPEKKIARLVVGGGPELPALQALAARLGVAEDVEFAGYLADPISRLIEFALSYGTEQLPIAMLDDIACGTPDVVSTPDAGVLMPARSGSGLTQAWAALFANDPSRQATRAHAETFSWDATTQGQLSLFGAITGKPI